MFHLAVGREELDLDPSLPTLKTQYNEVLLISINYLQTDIKYMLTNTSSLGGLVQSVSSSSDKIRDSFVKIQQALEYISNEKLFKEEMSKINKKREEDQAKRPEEAYTADMVRLREFLSAISNEILILEKDLKHQLHGRCNSLKECRDKFQQIGSDLSFGLLLHHKTMSMFDEANLSTFYENQQNFKFQQLPQNLNQNGNLDDSQSLHGKETTQHVDSQLPAREPAKTEVFENFEIIDRQKSTNKQN